MGGDYLMPTCPQCHVHVDGSLSHCPICGNHLQEVDLTTLQTVYPTPDYQMIRKKRSGFWHTLFALPLITALIVTIGIDLLIITDRFGVTFLVTFIVFYAWILIYKNILNHKGIGYLILWQLIGLSLVTTVIAYLRGQTFNAWPLQYVVPILIALANTLYIIISSIRRQTDVILFQMLIAALFGLLQFSLIFWLIPLTVITPSIVAGSTSLLSFIALFTYLRKKFFRYLQRWLHI
jgi:hypothetical protein